MSTLDASYQPRWRHRRWIDVAVAAAFPLTPLFLAIWDACGAPSLGVGLSDLPKIMALSGVFGACVPAAWWWARVVPAMGRVIDPEFRREMRLTPTPPTEIVAVEVTTRAWWASLVLPAHIVVVCAGAIAEVVRVTGAVRVTSHEIVWIMVIVASMFCLFLVVAFRVIQALAWSLALLHSRHGRGGWLTWSWIQFVVGLALANVVVYGAGPSCLLLLEALRGWLWNLTSGGPHTAALALAVVTVGVIYASLALYGLGRWVQQSRRTLVELLGRPEDTDEVSAAVPASTHATAPRAPSVLALWWLGMGTAGLFLAAYPQVRALQAAAPLVLLLALVAAVATLRWALATTNIGGKARLTTVLALLAWSAVGPALGVAITTAAMTLWLVQPDPFVWIDLDPFERLQGVAGLLAATFVALVFLLASGEVFLRRCAPAPSGPVRWALGGAILVLVAWTLQGLVLLPMVFSGTHLRNKPSLADTPGVLVSSLLVLVVLVLLWFNALRRWWRVERKSITAGTVPA